MLSMFMLSLQTTGLVGLAVAENPHEVCHTCCSVVMETLRSKVFVMCLHVGMRCILIWCQLNETVKIVHSDKGLMHVILSYFTHVIFVACADFKSFSCVSIFMNQY